jgi:hypothetical protein
VNVGAGYNGFDRIYSVPVMGNIIFHRGNWRFGGGAGYSFNKRVSGSGSSGAALDIIAGYVLTHGRNPTNVDLRYFFISGADNELDGLSVTYGLKF